MKLYTDYQALLSILKQGIEASMRIIKWQDQLNEYDMKVHHRPGKSHLMRIADGLSRMLTRYTTIPVAEDTERMALPTITENDPYALYRESKEYGDIVTFLTQGSAGLRSRGLGASQIKNIRRKAKRYQLTATGLTYEERNGRLAKCILPAEVS